MRRINRRLGVGLAMLYEYHPLRWIAWRNIDRGGSLTRGGWGGDPAPLEDVEQFDDTEQKDTKHENPIDPSLP